MEIPKDMKNFYTINTKDGWATAVACPYLAPWNEEPSPRARCCIASGNFYLTLKEAKADAEKINEIFRKRVK